MDERKSSSRPYTVNSFGRKLELFQKFIVEFTHVDEELNPEERRLQLQERLTNGYEPFSAEIKTLFGSDVNSHDVKALFRKIAANPEAEVDWSELFGIGDTSQEQTEQLLADEGFSVFTVSKRKYLGEAGGDKRRRDFIRGISYVPKLDFFISSSEKGVVSQWNSKFRLQGCVDINETSWITGCDYCPGLRKIVITCERSLAIWDYRAKQKQSNIVHIKPLDQTIHCMTYVPWKLNGMPDDCILFGDDQGYINILRLSSKDLHMKNANTNNDSQTMIIDPAKLTNEIIKRKVHNDWVAKVKYFPQLQLFGSCSQCSVTSFVLGDLDKLLDQHPLRELSVAKGVNCFDYCARANIIATAGADKIIRMWHPLIFTRPTGKLIGHLFTISELTVNENDQHLYKFVNSQGFQNMGYPDAHMFAGSSIIEMWPLTRAIQDSLQLPHTHDRAVSHVLYNNQMNQVVTICLEPVLKLWEMETGQLVYVISEPHGPGHEVTAVNVNTTGYRLITGAYDGSIKVWDFGSGQLQKSHHHSLKDEIKDSTITGLVYFMMGEQQCVVVSSWGHALRVFEDSVTSDELVQLFNLSDEYSTPTFPKEIPPSADDVFPVKTPLPPIGESMDYEEHLTTNILSSCQVTCVDYSPPFNLVTGTTSGLVLLWNTKEQKIFQRFERLDSADGNAARRHSKHVHDSDYKLVHSCKFVTCLRETKKDTLASIQEVPQDDKNETVLDENNKMQSLRIEVEQPTSGTEDSGKDVVKTNENTMIENENISAQEQKAIVEDTEGLMEQNEHEADEVLSEYIESEGDDLADEEKEAPTIEEGRNGGADVDETPCQLGLVSAHHDGYIRFWNSEGVLFAEVRMTINQRSSSVSALSYENNSNTLISSDVRGYVTVWDIEEFRRHLASEGSVGDTSDNEKAIGQVIYWRAHLSKIVAVEQVKASDVVITASIDASVRVWHQHTGHFIGFFSQPRLWNIPNATAIPSTPLRPYDITEAPKKMLRQTAKAVKHKPKNNQSVDCPLAFDDKRWKPFRYSAKEETRSREDNKKFFNSLSKPRHYNFHLDSWQTGAHDPGAVFRSLPVYKINEPERLKTPAVNSSSWLTNPITGTVYTSNKPMASLSSEVAKSHDNFITRFPHTVHHKR